MSAETLTQHINAILIDPDVPDELYNEIVETLDQLLGQAFVSHTTPEVLMVALPLALSRLKNGVPTRGTASSTDASTSDRPHYTFPLWHPIKKKRALDLLGKILIVGDEEQNLALAALIMGLTDSNGNVDKVNAASEALRHIFQYSNLFVEPYEAFTERAIKV